MTTPLSNLADAARLLLAETASAPSIAYTNARTRLVEAALDYALAAEHEAA